VAHPINGIYVDVGSLDLNNDVEGAVPPLALQLPGVWFSVTFVALGVALVRAHAKPRWCAVALAVAGVLFPVSRIGGVETLAAVADVVFLLALTSLGWAIFQGTGARGDATPSRGAITGRDRRLLRTKRSIVTVPARSVSPSSSLREAARQTRTAC